MVPEKQNADAGTKKVIAKQSKLSSKSKKPKKDRAKKTKGSIETPDSSAPKALNRTTKGKTSRIKGGKLTKSKNSAPLKASKAKKTRRPKSTAPSHWIDTSDEVLFRYEGEGSKKISEIRFKVRGNPRPLTRHRSGFGGRMYNPSAILQETFRLCVQELVFSEKRIHPPLFPDEKNLEMTIIFRLKRPLKDFVGGKRGPDRMRENAPPQTSQTRTDVDNLTKFVLDSMNELLYEDDRQILSLHVTKVLDNEGLCEGSTEVYVRSINEKDVDILIHNSSGI